ncbi:YqzM family protein [Chengkuizengella sediminis]|nr:YqzM family protein [Chengkuizengella sediminis]NDI36804.1 YqzM family protein [Chengkuizengella sediminis]
MSETRQPELHVNEEPRNDFIDVGVGFAVSTGIFFLIAIIATILSVISN